MSRQIDKAHNPTGLHRNLIPAQLLSSCRSRCKRSLVVPGSSLSGSNVVCWVDRPPVGRESQDLHSNAAGPPGLDFMLVSEQSYTCFASSIVQRTSGQDTEGGTLPRVYVANYCDSNFDGILDAIWWETKQVNRARWIVVGE